MTTLPDPVRRRLEEVFGEVLPNTTADERDHQDPAARDHDAELLADRPPHHDQER